MDSGSIKNPFSKPAMPPRQPNKAGGKPPAGAKPGKMPVSDGYQKSNMGSEAGKLNKGEP
jgi:hypothetical protein